MNGTPSGTTTAEQLTYGPEPTIIALSTSAGLATGGQSVLIFGNNFAVGSSTDVAFGDIPATGITCNNMTTCTVTSPASAGLVDVSLIVGGVTSRITNADHFSYIPVVIGVSPNSGAATGGTRVAITGAGFATREVFGPTASEASGASHLRCSLHCRYLFGNQSSWLRRGRCQGFAGGVDEFPNVAGRVHLPTNTSPDRMDQLGNACTPQRTWPDRV